MSIEIGSEYFFDFDQIVLETTAEPSFLSKLNHYSLTSSGRGAISLILSFIASRIRSSVVALPAYLCDSIVQSFRSNGYSCKFYDINSDLTPDLGSIERLPEIGVFFHLGYFGFNTNSNLRNFIEAFRAQGVIIIEDRTHNFFSCNSSLFTSDYYIASLRKWSGLPGGGIVWPLSVFLREINSTDPNSFVMLRKKAMILKDRYIRDGNQMLKSKYLELFGKAEALLDMDSEPYRLDDFSRSILFALNAGDLMASRRENFLFLLKNLKFSSYFYPVFNQLPTDVTPFFFPIYIMGKRDDLRSYLRGHSVYCPIHWPVPSIINFSSLPLVGCVYNNILSIPCDQRYSLEDMCRIVDCISQFGLL